MSQSEGIQRFLHHYNASIRALIHDQPPTFVVLMACLLFWAIENFNGGDVVAHAHLTAAVRILNEWKATNPTPDTEDPSTEMITKYIEPCIQDGLRQLPSATVPLAPDEPEEGKGKQPETLSDLRLPQIQFQTTLGNFSSLEEATKNLHTNLQHLLDLQVLGYAYSGDHGRIRDVIHAISSQLDKWLGSFSGIMHSADVAPKRVLFIHHIVAKFLLREVAQTVKAEDDLEEPDITPHLNYVVTEIDEMMQEFNHIKTQSSPSKDLSTDFPPNLEIIPALFAAATSSTEIATRVKAIDLLKKLDRTEGAWNSKVAACVAETILGLGNARRFSISSDTEPSSHTISFNTLKFYWRLDSRHRLNITIVHSPTEGGSVTIDKQLQCTNEEISALNLVSLRLFHRRRKAVNEETLGSTTYNRLQLRISIPPTCQKDEYYKYYCALSCSIDISGEQRLLVIYIGGYLSHRKERNYSFIQAHMSPALTVWVCIYGVKVVILQQWSLGHIRLLEGVFPSVHIIGGL